MKVVATKHRTVDSDTSTWWSSRSRCAMVATVTGQLIGDPLIVSIGDRFRGQRPRHRVHQFREPASYPRPPHLLKKDLGRARLQTLGQRRGQRLADRFRLDVQCLIRLDPRMGWRSSAGTSPRSRSRSTISSPPQAPSRNPRRGSPERSEPEQLHQPPPDTPQGGELRDRGWGIT